MNTEFFLVIFFIKLKKVLVQRSTVESPIRKSERVYSL